MFLVEHSGRLGNVITVGVVQLMSLDDSGSPAVFRHTVNTKSSSPPSCLRLTSVTLDIKWVVGSLHTPSVLGAQTELWFICNGRYCNGYYRVIYTAN